MDNYRFNMWKLMSRVMGCADLFFPESSWHVGRHDGTKVLWRWAGPLDEVLTWGSSYSNGKEVTSGNARRCIA